MMEQPSCHICGQAVDEQHALILESPRDAQPEIWACHKHAGRIGCVVPHCRRTTAGRMSDGYVWICGTHWAGLTRAEKADYYQIRKIGRRKGWGPARISLYRKILKRLGHLAVERAFGVG